MKLERVIISGFRSYRDKITVDISEMTAFIGKNNIGKTSILEALDGFFNSTIDADDFSTNNCGKKILIGCVFSNPPEKIFIADDSYIVLKDEKMLNKDGCFEIYKEWDEFAGRAILTNTYIKSYTAYNKVIKNLIHKNKDELQEILNEFGSEKMPKNKKNMRKEIYSHYCRTENSNMRDINIDLYKCPKGFSPLSDGSMVLRSINRKYLPMYTLFRIDQIFQDGSNAIDTSLNYALKSALNDFEDELNDIYNKVVGQVHSMAQLATRKFEEKYLDVPLDVIPKYEPNWHRAFTLTGLESDDEVQFSKKGTGFRRLVMLAFFSEMVKKRHSERADGKYDPSVIYAIEEPENSQHPKIQHSIVEMLTDLVHAGAQVLITTHVPELMKLIETDSIRFIDHSKYERTPVVSSMRSNKNLLKNISDSLGIYPNTNLISNTKVVVWVEGITDKQTLECFADILIDCGKFPECFDIEHISFESSGGCNNLGHKIDSSDLENRGMPQFYLFDSDKTCKDDDDRRVPEKLINASRRWKKDRKGTPVGYAVTRKRAIENYIHEKAVKSVLGNVAVWTTDALGFDWDYGKVANQSINRHTNWDKREYVLWDDLVKGNRKKYKEVIENLDKDSEKPKQVVSTLVLKHMTYDLIRERCRTTDDPNKDTSEVEDWFQKIADLTR